MREGLGVGKQINAASRESAMATFTDLTVEPVPLPAAGDGAMAEKVRRAVQAGGLEEFLSRAPSSIVKDTLVEEISQTIARAPAGQRTGAQATDGQPKDVWPGGWTILLTLVVLVIGFGFAWWKNQPSFTPTASFNVFAVMYIIAQAIERVLDPFAPFLGRAKADSDTKSAGRDEPAGAGATTASYVDQPTAKSNRDAAVVAALKKHGNEPAAKAAAKAQRTVDQVRANLTLLMWGISSMLAMLASGLLGLYLLKTVGMTNAPTWLDIAVTGLAIGAGTKPLHDLISNMSASKSAKQDPPQTAKAG